MHEECGCTLNHNHKHRAYCYSSGGRCTKCREWRAGVYARRRHHEARKRAMRGVNVSVPAGSTVRRLKALAVNGWGPKAIAELAGLSNRNLFGIRALVDGKVSLSTARAVRDVYQKYETRICDTPIGKAMTTRALKNGWLGPWDWEDIEAGIPAEAPSDEDVIDSAAVEQAIAGRHVALTHAEKVEVVRRMNLDMCGDREIAGVVGGGQNYVRRIREGLGLPGWTRHEQRKAA